MKRIRYKFLKWLFEKTKDDLPYIFGETSRTETDTYSIVVSRYGTPTFKVWLENWKPIHLCWLFLKLGIPIPKYLIGLTTTSTSSSSRSTSSSSSSKSTSSSSSKSTSSSSLSSSSSSSSTSSLTTSTTMAISWNNYLFFTGGGSMGMSERIRGQTYGE